MIAGSFGPVALRCRVVASLRREKTHVKPLNLTVEQVTQRIVQRSRSLRSAYLQRLDRMADRPAGVARMGCANVAHTVAAMPSDVKISIMAQRAPNVGIVTAYNDMLSAHKPYESYPDLLRDEASKLGVTVQVAGGAPAMCDGVTQGLPGMELSLFSRDTIAMATAIALSHDVYDAALLLGVCDKIVPGLLIGALHFGHLPCVFVPAGPMSTGLSNEAKSLVRERFAKGEVDRDALLQAENAAYHGVGTCTFYGTANSNQMLLEAMGLHVPGAAFVHPHAGAREALTRAALGLVVARTRSRAFLPIGKLVDEGTIVNAMVALLATGGSTNHLIHWVAVARAAGILIDWDDFGDLSGVVPLLARVYPNGQADVNQFQAAGGPALVIAELLRGGLMHPKQAAVHEAGIAVHGRALDFQGGDPGKSASSLAWPESPVTPSDDTVVRGVDAPFSPTGGLKVLRGNLGRSVIKTSAVPEDRWVIEAPVALFDSQESVAQAFKAGQLDRDVVVVVRFQGPKANGMPELHKLTPLLAVLQGKGRRVALVTDGRMSGASGKVPAAIHVVPEALEGGALARLQDGDVVRLDARAGTLDVMVGAAAWRSRQLASRSPVASLDSEHDLGRELFAGMRSMVTHAEQGARTWGLAPSE
jgi:phosphogluconate dehydratase